MVVLTAIGTRPVRLAPVLALLLSLCSSPVGARAYSEEPAPAGVPAPAAATRAVAAAEGVASPGLRLSLRGDRSTGAGLRYRWVQVRGEPVALDDPAAPVARFTVPAGAGTLAFLLVVSGPGGMDVAPVVIAVEGAAPGADAGLRADAGDDLIAIVGRQVTLNGIRSEPRGALAYRWIQVGGPPIALKLEDAYIYSFVPQAPGTYRFALVVAAEGAISEPDAVDVVVSSAGASPGGPPAGAPATPPAPAPPPGPVAAPRTMSTAELASVGALSLEEGPDAAARLAVVYQAMAEKMSLYESYTMVAQELARRLEEVVPADAARRTAWNERLFVPLMNRTVERMRIEGLDLGVPASQSAPLTEGQKRELAQLFLAVAQGFRAVGPPSR